MLNGSGKYPCLLTLVVTFNLTPKLTTLACLFQWVELLMVPTRWTWSNFDTQ